MTVQGTELFYRTGDPASFVRLSYGFIAIGAVVVVLLGTWAISGFPGAASTDDQPAGPQGGEAEDVPYCTHLLDSNVAHQIVVQVTTAPDTPPAPRQGVMVTVTQDDRTVDTATTDEEGCASVEVPAAGAYVFRADYERSQGNVDESWDSGDVPGRYDGDSPGWLALELSGYTKIDWGSP
jgi:hypothetical protein